MIKLIISFDSYSWIKYIAGIVMSDKVSRYDLMILKKDDKLPLLNCKSLCKKAIYEQRRYDLFKIGKKIGITKLMNLGYDDLPINKIVAQLQLYTMLSNINTIYAPNNSIFTSIFKNTNANLYFYDFGDTNPYTTILDKDIYKRKIDLKNFMIGVDDKKDSDLYKPIERVYAKNSI
jgi:hypothetical protein